ncbi:hypothetical protein ABK905_05855 [Acerihabitans sp. KWT182]|uniref:Deubiquitinase SseL n=1 Tax=Acerihabitans sp. KWT182 TaxID=3157919 RepID=A0AAU7QBQ3_9GAMM
MLLPSESNNDRSFSSDPSAKLSPFLCELKDRARNNEAPSIEYLFTQACEASSAGKEAEQFLFDLYSGKETGDAQLRRQLGQDSLRLFTLVQQRNHNTQRESTDIWELPTKLLLMAAFEAENGSPQQAEVFDRLRAATPFLSYVGEVNEFLPTTALSTGRFISSSEIDAFSQQLPVDNTRRFYPATGVSEEETAANRHDNVMLSLKFPGAAARHAAFDGVISSDGAPASSPVAGFIPLVFRQHWILFGWFSNKEGQKEAIVMDSQHYLNESEKKYLQNLALRCGVQERQEVTFFDNDLQQHAPNACGLLVAKAMESLAGNDDWRPEMSGFKEILKNFTEQFAAGDIEQQRLFNQHGRAELYAALAQSIDKRDD